jgi:putative inorganic carbon (HCO3(-)) transporter
MGLVLTTLYIVLAIIGPEQFGQGWAGLHPLQYLAAFTLLASMPNVLAGRNPGSSLQTYLMLALIAAIGFSQVVNGWLGGIVYAWSKFLPSAATYFFVVANVTTVRKLKFITLVTVATCLVVAAESLSGYYWGFGSGTFVLHQNIYSQDEIVGQLLRVRAVGFLNDPNDYAQLLLIALPLIFVAWQSRRILINSMVVLMPSGLMLWTIYLTHSRGALIGLIVLSLFAARKRISKAKSLVLTGSLILVALGMNFMGGRGISASEGSDRLEAWATGLELLKSAPLFGIGFGSFTDFNGITAHNSLILCLAELGVVGGTIWLALLVTTTMGLNDLLELEPAGNDGNRAPLDSVHPNEDPARDLEIAPYAVKLYSAAGTPIDSEESSQGCIGSLEYGEDDSAGPLETILPDQQLIMTSNAVAAEVDSIYSVPKAWIEVIRLAMIAFVSTSWFLSRSYAFPMYLIIGLATATSNIQSVGIEHSRRNRWLAYTLATEGIVILIIYFLVRLRR